MLRSERTTLKGQSSAYMPGSLLKRCFGNLPPVNEEEIAAPIELAYDLLELFVQEIAIVAGGTAWRLGFVNGT
jgi:hypothetical protein